MFAGVLSDNIINKILDHCRDVDRKCLTFVTQKFFDIMKSRRYCSYIAGPQTRIMSGQDSIPESFLDLIHRSPFTIDTLFISHFNLDSLERYLSKNTNKTLGKDTKNLIATYCSGTLQSLSSITQLLFDEDLKSITLVDCCLWDVPDQVSTSFDQIQLVKVIFSEECRYELTRLLKGLLKTKCANIVVILRSRVEAQAISDIAFVQDIIEKSDRVGIKHNWRYSVPKRKCGIYRARVNINLYRPLPITMAKRPIVEEKFEHACPDCLISAPSVLH